MSTLRYRIADRIHEAIDSFDFTSIIMEAIDNVALDDIINDALYDKVHNELDLSRIAETIVKEILEEELDDLDIDDIVYDLLH